MNDPAYSPATLFQFPEINRYRPDNLFDFARIPLPEDGPQWFGPARQAALVRLCEKGLPSPRLERWSYTNLPQYLKKMDGKITFQKADVTYNLCDESVLKPFMQAPDHCAARFTRQVFGAEDYQDTMLADHVQAYTRDGLVIEVPEGKAIEKPMEIFIKTYNGHLSVPRTLFHLHKNARMTIIEYHDCPDGDDALYWKNRLTQILVEDGAVLHHYRIQNDSKNAAYTQFTEVEIQGNGQYKAFNLAKGCGLSRNQIHAVLLGEGGDCTLNGINLLDGDQLADTTITIEHKAPGTTSNQFYRSILNDKATGVFQGKVHVHQNAQQTNAYQLSNALMIGRKGAAMNTKPELEIYADDVKCSHGATSGQLDDEPLFYMQARGISPDDAKKMLAKSFLSEVTKDIDECEGEAEIAANIHRHIDQWLEKSLV